MVTIFTHFKPFEGHIAVIQRNAVQSWCGLRPACQIIVFGDVEGTAETADEFGLHHSPTVTGSEYGTALLDAMFEVAQQKAIHSVVCYVNADIMLLSDFTAAVRSIPFPRFLVVGQRWDLDVEHPWGFTRPDWETRIRELLHDSGTLHAPWGIDYFVFPRGLISDMPPFAVGGPMWDQWMIFQARSLGIPVIDATAAITAIHQNHDYSHHAQGKVGVRWGPDGLRNRALAGDNAVLFDIRDATHLLVPAAVKPAHGTGHLRRRLAKLPVVAPHLGPLLWPSRMYMFSNRILGAVIQSARRLLRGMRGTVQQRPH